MLPPISDVGGIASQSEAIVPHKPRLKSHLCASCGCVVRPSDLKAVGEDTLGGPVPGSLEAFTAVYLKYLYVWKVLCRSQNRSLLWSGALWITEWLHSLGASIKVVSENQKGKMRNTWGGEGRRIQFRWDYSNIELRHGHWEGTFGHLPLMAKDEVTLTCSRSYCCEMDPASVGFFPCGFLWAVSTPGTFCLHFPCCGTWNNNEMNEEQVAEE